MEIGPSYNPLMPKREGWQCYSIDHTDQRGLVEKYRHDPTVNVAMIEPVDFVWSKGTLSDAIPAEHHGTFDVLVASHVLEHIPELLGFLQSAEVVVRSDGRMVLALPDKRVCFDFFRPLTTTGDLLEAHWEGRARHSPKTLWDYFAYQVTKNSSPGWGRTDRASAVFTYTLDDAFTWTKKHDSDAYIDAHCSIFVPASFALIMFELARLGLTDWLIERSEAAEYTEFYVWLRRGALKKVAAMSEIEFTTERSRLLEQIVLELSDQARQLTSTQVSCREHDLTVARLQEAGLELVARLEKAQTELTNARSTVEVMRASRAWRIRSHLRRLMRLPATLSDM